MRLHASCELRFESQRETPVVLMLRSRADADQHVILERLKVQPALPSTEFNDVLGNRCDRFVAPRGELLIQSDIVAEVTAHGAKEASASRTVFSKLPAEALHYTLPSRYCPADKVQSLAREITRGCRPGYHEVQTIRDYVHEQLTYRYDVSDGSTDALDTLKSGAGVCRDFAHVAITLCRSIDIPARMVAGYLHGREPMDLHAWFEAHVGRGWYPFDATETELRGGRIVLAQGRDAADVAFATDYGALALRSMQVAVRETLADRESRTSLRAVG